MPQDFSQLGIKAYRTPSQFLVKSPEHRGAFAITDPTAFQGIPVEDVTETQLSNIFGGTSSENLSSSQFFSKIVPEVQGNVRSRQLQQQQQQQADIINQFQASKKGVKGIFELPETVEATQRQQFVIKDGILTSRSSITAQEKEEADFAAGLTERVRVGSGFAYIPKGSPGAQLAQQIQAGTAPQQPTGVQQPQTQQVQPPQGQVQIGTSPSGQPLYAPVGSPAALLQQQKQPPAGTQPPTIQPTQPQTQFGPSSYTGPSIMDYLSSKGQNPSFSSRRQLAAQFLPGQSYTGSPEQNTELLRILKSQGQQVGADQGANLGVTQDQFGNYSKIVNGTQIRTDAQGNPLPTLAGAIPTGVQQYQNLLSMTANLQTGARGAEVQQLQQFLQSQGIDVGNIDSIFGPKTAAGLKQFQQQSGIGVDGIVGPITRQKIQEKLGAGQVDVEPPPQDGLGGEEEPLSPAQQEYSDHLQQKSYDDIYTQLSDEIGLKTIKTQFEEFNTKLEEVRNKTAGKVADINNNPWISETLRSRKVANAEAASKQEEANMLDGLNQLQKIYNDAQQEVQFRAKLQVEQQNKDREFDFKVRLQAAQLEAKAKNIQTRIANVGNRQVLINSQTGETIKDLGPTSYKDTAGGVAATPEELEDLDTQIYDLMGGLSPEQLDELISLGLI